ncbi:cystatin-C-like [Hydractinia symbiolongicarpus]|uniref:cystatin-C-like n=1 Tax=Hydractinia symbiolongicarpus TaxID=13093 RepID=UPI00254E5521|nr:cystatin-C-like [Hydractinia symbiolongicarpus]
MYSVLVFLAGIACAVAGLGGGIFEMSKEEISKAQDLMTGVDMAVDQLNEKNNRRENKMRLVAESIVRASRQVVSGTLYRVEIRMVSSVCKNTDANSNKKITDCPADNSGVSRRCKFTIWSRPWVNEKKQILIRGIHCSQN